MTPEDLERLRPFLGVSALLLAFGLAMGVFAWRERARGRSRGGFGMIGLFVGFPGVISFLMAASAMKAGVGFEVGMFVGSVVVGVVAGLVGSSLSAKSAG